MQKNKALALLRCCITISIPFVVALITVIVIRNCNPVIISGQSMKPTLNNGELVFGDKSFTVDDLKRGTIIVFKDPEDENSSLIKRIVGLPGETVEITGGRIHINGELIQDPSSKAGTAATEPRKLGRPLPLKENEFAVLGDNRSNSFDSRDFGAINFRDIKYVIRRPIVSFANGKAIAFVMDKIIKFKIAEKQTIHFRANIPDTDTRAVALMKAVNKGHRNSFCKALFRNSFAQQNLSGYFGEEWCYQLLNTDYYNKGIDVMSNIIPLDEFHRDSITRTIEGSAITHTFDKAVKSVKDTKKRNPFTPLDAAPQAKPQENIEKPKPFVENTEKTKEEVQAGEDTRFVSVPQNTEQRATEPRTAEQEPRTVKQAMSGQRAEAMSGQTIERQGTAQALRDRAADEPTMRLQAARQQQTKPAANRS